MLVVLCWAAERGDTFGAFFVVEIAAGLAFLTECGAVFGFDFAAFVLVALWARALPAGDRFVAGFRRVSFAFDDDLSDRRVDDRGESFLPLLANGVLMREMPRVANGLEQTAAKTAGKSNIGLLLNQRKIRVCGLRTLAVQLL